MKKIFAWLSGGVIKEIGNAIDKLTTTEEEKLIIKKQVQQILEEADNNAQVQVTERWKSDMNSDSFLSPLLLLSRKFPASPILFSPPYFPLPV